MPISFLIQSKKNPAPIYIRVTEGKEIDAKVRTKYVVDPSRFSKKRIMDYKIPPGAASHKKLEIFRKNQELSILREKLEQLRSHMSAKLNDRNFQEVINARWLKRAMDPDEYELKLPSTLTEYFDDYHSFKNTSLKKGTVKNNNVIKARILNYEKKYGPVSIGEVNKKFSLAFQKWCQLQGYDHNTMVKSLKTIRTICQHALDRGARLDPSWQLITKSLKYQKMEPIFLTLEEIRLINEKPMPTERLDIARDWLVISCFTAQRVSDFLKFSKENIVELEGVKFIDITQQKTDSQVLLPLMPEVIKILDKRGGEFPPLFSKNGPSNEAMYNLQVKKVCEHAGINKIVTTKIKNQETNRYEIVEVAKYEAVSSHIGRRSYATNYYGKIPTSLLISATGHSSETQFLRYVGKKPTHNALALARAMKNLLNSD